MKLLTLTITVLIMIISGCGSGERDSSDRRESSRRVENVDIPVFNADSAYYFVERQVRFGPRVPNTPAHNDAGNWLHETLARFADTVYVQSTRVRAVDGTVLNIRNFIGSFQPQRVNRILLCAHWDSRPWADHDPDPANHYRPIDGANDGASGVGVLLEIARLLNAYQPHIGVDIMLFDAEDYGQHRLSNARDNDSWALGSQFWASRPHIPDYNARFGILLDMVGAQGATFKQEGYSMMYAPNIVRKVWSTARNLGYGNYFVNTEGGYIIDDHYYINRDRNIPVINIIDQRGNTPHGFFEYWHTVNDTMDVIEAQTLKVVGQTVIAVIWNE
jgi:Zn-dependent M28 family amino/carboxypeptidase